MKRKKKGFDRREEKRINKCISAVARKEGLSVSTVCLEERDNGKKE